MRRKPGELWGTGWGSLVVLLSLAFIPAASLGQGPAASQGQFPATGGSGSSGSSSGGPSVQATPAQVNSNTYQGSIVKQAPVPGVLPLSLDQAVRMGLQYNLGLVLSGTNAESAGAHQLHQFQPLLPTVNASAKHAPHHPTLPPELPLPPVFPPPLR